MDHTRSRVLGSDSIPAAVNFRSISHTVKCRLDVLIQRLSDRARLLGSVKNCNAFYCLRQNVDKVFLNKRSVKSYLYKSNTMPVLDHCVYRLFDSFAYGAHSNNNLLSVGSADIIERLVASACQLAYFIHIFNYNIADVVIVLVPGFSSLEINIRILRCSHDHRVFRIQGSVSEFIYGIPVDQVFEVLVAEHFYFLYFM